MFVLKCIVFDLKRPINFGQLMSRGYSTELYDSYLQFLENGSIPQAVTSTRDNFKREARKHTNLNGVILRKSKLVLRVNELSSVWQTHHVSLGHPGTFY